MKIFVSHSSRQKLFVQAIQSRLPSFITLWLDERELLLGDDIETTLEEAINNRCDLVMVVVDGHAAQSEWVKKEIAWTLQREQLSGRQYLLPIVLELDAWQRLLDEPLRKRKYLHCPQFSEIDSFADKLVLELFALLDREHSRRQPPAPSPIETLNSANALATSLAEKVRTIVHSHRRDNPLTIAELAAQLREDAGLPRIDVPGTLDLLRRLRSGHLLGGIFNDSEHVYLARESNFYKRTLFAPAKRAIAKAAAQMIESGYRIGIDGGSTALELAMYLAEELRAESITDLQIFTNSVPVAYSLLETLSQLSAGGRDVLCRVILMGGWGRPTSLNVIPMAQGAGSASHICPLPADLDMAFLGTNGLHGSDGFAIAHDYEVSAKRALIEAARRKIFLVDPSKFDVQQHVRFAKFDEGLEILTVHDHHYAAAIEKMKTILSGTPSTLTVLPC